MTTQVIYTRVPEELKEAADAYADERGAKLSSAIVDLLERGLTAVSDDRSIANMEQIVSLLTNENARLKASLNSARTELSAVKTLAQRASQPVGKCPTCSNVFSGYDLLATGTCHSCSESLSKLLTPSARSSGLDQREFLILVGALGAVVGLAILAGKG
jgi:antitoxin component of RelBE/YafQ-DinJ toxin-antitoxin module